MAKTKTPILDFLIDNLTSLKKKVEKTKKKRAQAKKKKTAAQRKTTQKKKPVKKTVKKTVSKKKVVKKKAVKKAISTKKTAKKKTAKKKTSPIKKRSKAQKTTKKKFVPKSKTVAKEPSRVVLGEVTHFFSKIKVAVIKVSCPKIQVGDKISIEGATSKFKVTIQSLQIESVDVKSAKKGQVVGLKIPKPARVGDRVYKA